MSDWMPLSEKDLDNKLMSGQKLPEAYRMLRTEIRHYRGILTKFLNLKAEVMACVLENDCLRPGETTCIAANDRDKCIVCRLLTATCDPDL